MEDKYFNVEEAMIDYAEMTSFNFNSNDYLACSAEKEYSEKYLQKASFLKFGKYDILDMLKSMVSKVSLQKG